MFRAINRGRALAVALATEIAQGLDALTDRRVACRRMSTTLPPALS